MKYSSFQKCSCEIFFVSDERFQSLLYLIWKWSSVAVGVHVAIYVWLCEVDGEHSPIQLSQTDSNLHNFHFIVRHYHSCGMGEVPAYQEQGLHRLYRNQE